MCSDLCRRVIARARRALLFAAVAALANGCALQGAQTTGGAGGDAATPPADVLSDPESRLTYHVLAGELAVQRGLASDAAYHYRQASTVSDDPEVAERAVRLSLLANDVHSARLTAIRWATLAPDNLRGREVAARLALAEGDARAALANARAVLDLDPDGAAAAFNKLAVLFSSEEEHADTALQVMQSLVDDYPQLAGAHYANGVLQMRFERYPAAAASADRALELDVSLTDAYLLKAGALLQLGNTQQAEALMQTALARAPSDLELRLGYARMLLKADRRDAATRQFAAVLERQPENPEALYALGLVAIDASRYEDARRYFLRLLDTGARPDSGAYYLGRIEELQGRYGAALQWYERVEGGPQALNATLRRAYVLFKLGRLDDARAFLQQVRANNPQVALRLYQVEGELLYEAQRYQAAVELYTRALEDFSADPDLLYSRAMAATEAGQVEDAVADLERIIADNPDNAGALNALGYILTNHSSDYDTALGYIERALALAPDNPAVMDSMGWVQYQLGNLQSALDYLRAAYAKSPDSEIAAHLGEVLWATGRRDEARRVWQKALAQDPDSAAIRDTMERLTEQ